MFKRTLAAATLAAAALVPAALAQTAAPPNPHVAPVAEFMKRVNDYVAIHREAENAAPKLPKEATPVQIDQTQRALAARIQEVRTGAKRGDIFTPEMAAFIKALLNRVFSGKDGTQLRSSIMDENVEYIALKVNQRYPDVYPRTTMPPDVLKALPELPEQMEYRFVGAQLILLDQHAHIIPDFIPDALPRK